MIENYMTRKIKVLEVIRQGQIGGGESHLLDLIYFFDKEVIEPVCLSFSKGEMISRLNNMGITCYVIDTEKPFDLKVQQRIITLLKDEGIQIVHAHGSRAASNVLYPTRKLGLPLVYTVHGWSFHDDQSFLVKTLRAWSEKLICHFADEVICVSQSNADTGQKVFGLKSAVVIENGVNLDRFNPDLQYEDLRSTFGFDSSDFIVGFIARCTKQKNPLVFLEAIKLAHHNNVQIKGLFIGEGDMDAEVDAYIESNQMREYIYRSPFRTDVPELLNCIDVYCLPSLWEGLSIALLEAMAMKKAIVATPTDGTVELIEHEKNGLIVPYNDPKAVAESFGRFLTEQHLKTQCSNSARQIVKERFDAKRVAACVQKIYHQLLERKE